MSDTIFLMEDSPEFYPFHHYEKDTLTFCFKYEHPFYYGLSNNGKISTWWRRSTILKTVRL